MYFITHPKHKMLVNHNFYRAHPDQGFSKFSVDSSSMTMREILNIVLKKRRLKQLPGLYLLSLNVSFLFCYDTYKFFLEIIFLSFHLTIYYFVFTLCATMCEQVVV